MYAPNPVTRFTSPGSVWQYGFVGVTAGPTGTSAALFSSGSSARTPQLSCTVFPTLKPAWNVKPFRGRAFMIKRMLLECEYWLVLPGRSSVLSMRFEMRPNLFGLTS